MKERNDGNIIEENIDLENKRKFERSLELGRIDDAYKLSQEYNLPDDYVQETVKQAFLNNLRKLCIVSNFKIIESFKINNKLINSSEVQECAKEAFVKSVNRFSRYSSYNDAVSSLFVKNFNLPEDFVRETVKHAFIKNLSEGEVDIANKLRLEFNLPEDFIRESVKQAYINKLAEGCVNEAIKIKNIYTFIDEIVELSEVHELVKQAFIKKLSDGNVYDAIKIKNTYIFVNEFTDLPEVQEVAKQVFINKSSEVETDIANKLKLEFNLPEDFVQETVKQIFISKLSKGNVYEAYKLKTEFVFIKELVDSPEVQEIAKQALIKKLFDGELSGVNILRLEFNLPEDFFIESVKQAFKISLLNNEIRRAIEINENYKLPEDFVKIVVQQTHLNKLSEGDLDTIYSLKKFFKLDEDVNNKFEAQEIAKQAFVNELSKGLIFSAHRISQEYNLPDDFVKEAVKKAFFDKLEAKHIVQAAEIDKYFNIESEIINSDKVQETVKQFFIIEIDKPADFTNSIGFDVFLVISRFKLPEDFVQKTVKQTFKISLLNDRVKYAIKINEKFNLAEDFVQETVKQVMLQKLKEGEISYVQKLTNKFEIDDRFNDSLEAQESAKQAFVKLLEDKHFDLAYSLIQTYGLPDDFVNKVIKSAFIKTLEVNGFYYADQIAEKFNLENDILNSPEVQEIAKQTFIKDFLNNYGAYSHKMIKRFNLSNDFINETLKQIYISEISKGKVEYFYLIEEEFNLESEFFSSVEVQEAKKQALVTLVLQDKFDHAGTLKHKGLTDETLLDVYNLVKKTGNLLLLMKFTSAWPGTYITKKELDELYNSLIKEKILGDVDNNVTTDPQIKNNFEFLEKILGKDRLKRIFINNYSFWNNIHDSLIFVESIANKEKTEQENIVKLILVPILNQETDLIQLNELLNSFDVNLYNEKLGIPFKNWQEFEREVNMQKYNISVPVLASESFKSTVDLLIRAPGVDVSFIKNMIDCYSEFDDDSKSFTSSYQEMINILHKDDSQEEYIKFLINNIEHPELIDKEQMIKPFEAVIPFDPIHRLVLTSVGLHSLNIFTPKLVDSFKSNKDLIDLISQLEEVNLNTQSFISDKYDKLIKDEPTKKQRLVADKNKEIAMFKIFKKDDASAAITGMCVENSERYKMFFSDDVNKKINTTLKQALSDEGLKRVVVDMLTTFHQKRDSVGECVDLVVFEDVGSVVESWAITISDQVKNKTQELISDGYVEKEARSLARQEAVKNINIEDILKLFSGNELLLAELLIYFGFNNRTRQSQSKDIKNSMDRVFKQEKYRKTHNDPFLSYVKGELTIDDQDVETVKDILKDYDYDQIGRKLKIEILPKSDPRGWVCGDFTDCCMSFTSDKNKEYIYRADMAYFVISIVDNNDNEDLVAQSVLVQARNDKGVSVIAIDNIEIANRAIKFTAIISQAYEKLKTELQIRHNIMGQPFKLVIGASYNDDGGLVTSQCELRPIDAWPINGDIEYSDWLGHSNNFVYFDSNNKDTKCKFFGLQIDMFNNSKIKNLNVNIDDWNEIRTLLEVIGKGEDDGDGGLNFADNHSSVIEFEGKTIGYIIGANYLTDDDDDEYVTFEKLYFENDVDEPKKLESLFAYLMNRSFESQEDIKGLFIKQKLISENTWVTKFLNIYYKNISIKEGKDGVYINFN